MLVSVIVSLQGGGLKGGHDGCGVAWTSGELGVAVNVRGSIPGAPGAPGGGIPKGGGGPWPDMGLADMVLGAWNMVGEPGKPKGGGNAPGGTMAGFGTGWPSAA